jgi:hypothetical protein
VSSSASPLRLGAATVHELREEVRGVVVDPADPGYDRAGAVWNGDVADEQENPDLYWGLREGGGNFGVVTEFEYAPHDVGPVVYGGPIISHKAQRAGELLTFYSDWVTTLPDELTTMVVLITAPPEPFVPASLVGTPQVGVVCCHIGDHDDAERAIRPPPFVLACGHRPDRSHPLRLAAVDTREVRPAGDPHLLEGRPTPRARCLRRPDPSPSHRK